MRLKDLLIHENVGKKFQFVCKDSLLSEIHEIVKVKGRHGFHYITYTTERCGVIDERSLNRILRQDNDYKYTVKIMEEKGMKKINWSKVPKFTKVQVRDGEDNEWKNRYFVAFKKNTDYQFSTTMISEYIGDNESSCRVAYKQCRIHESIEIPKEWYEEEFDKLVFNEIIKEYENYCDEITNCNMCKYNGIERCIVAYVIENIDRIREKLKA